jgi:thiol-disulfide isomerase/thioredoxin
MFLKKQSRQNPKTVLDPYVGNMGIFRMSDFYSKSKQVNKLPETHEFDERLIDAYEFLYQLFSLQFQDQARPYFSSTLRIEGDAGYRTSSGSLSYHSRGRAADANWNQHSQEVEDFIVCVIGYDVEIKGTIYQTLRSMGINGFGTYYREPEGTFLHLDTRDYFQHFRKIKRGKIEQAKRWHQEFMQLAYRDNLHNATLNNGVHIPNEERNLDAMALGKSILWFKADWCAPCQAMKEAFAAFQDKNSDKDINWQIIDVTNNTPSDQEIKDRFGVISLPSLLFLQEGTELSRIEGGTSSANMQEHLDQLMETDPTSLSFITTEAISSTNKKIEETSTPLINTTKDLVQESANIFMQEGEDPFEPDYKTWQWTVRGILIVASLVFTYYLWKGLEKA